MIAAKGIRQIPPLLEAIAAETAIPSDAREMLALFGQEIEHLDSRIKAIEVKLIAMHKANPISRLLATIPGIGPIIALTLAIEVDPAAFKSGRHLAAWLGLAPKEHSTAGKQHMGGISRAGNERLRQLLVTGATAVIKVATRPGNKLAADWLLKLLQRRPRKLAAVALANKMARGRLGHDDRRRGLPPSAGRRRIRLTSFRDASLRSGTHARSINRREAHDGCRTPGPLPRGTRSWQTGDPHLSSNRTIAGRAQRCDDTIGTLVGLPGRVCRLAGGLAGDPARQRYS